MTWNAAAARRALVRALAILVWTGLLTLLFVVVSRWCDVERPAQVVLLQSVLPWVFLPAWVVLAVATWKRRWVMAVLSGFLALVHVLSLAPALMHHRPAWARTASTFTLLEANLYEFNDSPDSAAEALLAQHADVMAVVEMTPAMNAALTRGGVARAYPYRAIPNTDDYQQTEQIFSKFPLSDAHTDLLTPEIGFPSARFTVAGTEVRLEALHLDGAEHGVRRWRFEYDFFRQRARTADSALVLAGDFNANRWTPPFGRLLKSGLRDAHEQTRKGLTFSWPRWGPFGPFIRLDHALLNDRVAARSVHDFTVPGSDHVGFVATLAVRPQS